MTHNNPKLEKYLFPGIPGCIFAPATGGPRLSSCPEGSGYDSMPDLGEIRVYQRADFQSGSRVLKKVF